VSRGAIRPRVALLSALAGLAACGPFATGGPGCRPRTGPEALPDEIRESSGVAVSLSHPGVFWTMNDAGATLYGVTDDGKIVARFPVAAENRDWEDLALSTCPGRGTCLYIADLGDNYEERHNLRILRLPEPDPEAGASGRGDTLRVEKFPVRLPDGPRDIEAMFILPGERIHVVTKGRNDPITIYRYPPPLRSDTVTLEEVQRLTDGSRFLPRQVTGADASPRGSVVAIRTYESLTFYSVEATGFLPIEGAVVNLHPLKEPQGEGVGIGLDGLVALTSEGGPAGAHASITTFRCRIGGNR